MHSTPQAHRVTLEMIGRDIIIGSRVMYRGVNTAQWHGGRVVAIDPHKFAQGALQVKRDAGTRGWMRIGNDGVCALYEESLIGKPAVMPGRASVRYVNPVGNGGSRKDDKPQPNVKRDIRQLHPLFS